METHTTLTSHPNLTLIKVLMDGKTAMGPTGLVAKSVFVRSIIVVVAGKSALHRLGLMSCLGPVPRVTVSQLVRPSFSNFQLQ